jgi:phage terminase large subunit
MEENLPTLNPVLEDFWLEPARNKVLYGGRFSSKSWDAAGFSIFLADNYKLRVLCARQFQNKIEESVYSLLKVQIERFGLKDRFRILNNKIENIYTGTEFLFYGLWRNIDEIKSLEGVDICWLEEAHNISKEQWEILEPTIRKEHSQFWIVFNPKLTTDFVYRRFVTNPPPNTVVRKINYPENPFLSNTALSIAAAAKAEDEDNYNHIYLGQPKEDDNEAIIKRSWVMAAIDAHIKLNFKPEGKRRLGFDVADDGDDKCANAETHGSVIQWTDEWKAGEDEILQSCTRTYNKAVLDNSDIVYDSIGVGASSGSKFKELNDAQRRHIRYCKFNAGEKVWRPDYKYANTDMKNRDMFTNIKAQSWWLLADRFRNTYNAVHRGQKFEVAELISIDSNCPNLDKLIDELTGPRREYGADGRVKVESKEDMKKRGLPSPNLADAVIMSTALMVSVYDILD